MGERAAERGRQLLGTLLVQDGLVTRAQVEDALGLQRTRMPHLRLGQILVERDIITREALDRVLGRALATAGPRVRLGQVLVEGGVLTEAQLETALRHQRRTGLRLGEVLLQLDLVPERGIRQALAHQLGVAFVEPDALHADPEAAALVGRRYAWLHRVVPLARAGRALALLMADPSKAGVARELEATTGCQVRILTTTQAGFQKVFRQAYGEVG